MRSGALVAAMVALLMLDAKEMVNELPTTSRTSVLAPGLWRQAIASEGPLLRLMLHLSTCEFHDNMLNGREKPSLCQGKKKKGG